MILRFFAALSLVFLAVLPGAAQSLSITAQDGANENLPSLSGAPCGGLDISDPESFLRGLLKDVAARYEAIGRDMRQYAFHQEHFSFEHRKDGSFAPGSSALDWVYFSESLDGFVGVPLMRGGEEVSKAKREDAVKKQEKSLRAEHKRKTKRAGASEPEEKKKEGNTIQIGSRKMTFEEIMRFYRFTLEGCGEVEGREAHVVAYALREEALESREAARLNLPPVEGRLWVDREGGFLLRFEMSLLKKYKPGMSIRAKEMDLSATFSLVDGKHWFPTSMRYGFDARALLFFHAHEHGEIIRRDFRRFAVRSEDGGEIPSAPPSAEQAQ